MQSERQAAGLYLKYAKELIDKGEAYYCFCDKERLDSLKQEVAGKEIVVYDKHCLHLSKEEIERRAKEALTLVGIDESYYKKSPFELSGGEKRRVAIAGVLAMKPEVLILDEPTAGLDPRGRDEILGQLMRLHEEQGLTVILVSHSMEDVAKYVDRIMVMDHGCLVFDDTPRAVFAHYRELEKIGLAAPQVTYIAHALKEAGFPVRTDVITVAEAEEAILCTLAMDKEREN